ncbi:hypothetical protein [Reichenbachiella sp.]|uniref:hypothetical protein n=1 Tax=Reichenbachiella sp. TaxID=2184521 RepID=UPI003296FA90
MSIKSKLDNLNKKVEAVIESLQEIEGGYPVFAKGRENCSVGRFHKLKEKISEELERSVDPTYKDKSGIPFEEWSYVVDMNYILDQAENYIEEREKEAEKERTKKKEEKKQLEHSIPNKSWAIFYLEILEDEWRNKEKAKISSATIRTFNNDNTCLLRMKQPGSSLRRNYSGNYKWLREGFYSFNVSDNFTSFNITIRFRSDFSSLVGIYIKNDLNNAYGVRFIGEYLGEYSSKKFEDEQADRIWHKFVESGKSNALIKEIGSKDGNYISLSTNIEKEYNEHYRKIGFERGGIKSHLSLRYADFDNIDIYINTDTDLNSLNLDAKIQENVVISNLRNLIEDVTNKFYESARPSIDSVEDLLSINLRISYFIHIHTGSEKCLKSLILLGRCIETCKRILIFCKRGSVDEQDKLLLDEVHYSKSETARTKLYEYDDLDEDRDYIRKRIFAFIGL